MISAVAFSREYSSVWRALAPTTHIFVRRLNTDLYKREFVPLISEVAPDRRSLINEVAFRLFSRVLSETEEVWIPDDGLYMVVVGEVLGSLDYYSTDGSQIATEPSAREKEEILALYMRLRRFFASEGGREVLTYPIFPGCGILDTSAGDVYLSGTLFEVKAGDRTVRSVDVRQLLTYAALNMASERFFISKLGFFNPRLGTSSVFGLDELCDSVAGRPAPDLLREIIRVMSSGDISR